MATSMTRALLPSVPPSYSDTIDSIHTCMVETMKERGERSLLKRLELCCIGEASLRITKMMKMTQMQTRFLTNMIPTMACMKKERKRMISESDID